MGWDKHAVRVNRGRGKNEVGGERGRDKMQCGGKEGIRRVGSFLGLFDQFDCRAPNAIYLGFRAHCEAPPERAAHVVLPQVLVQERQDTHPLGSLFHGGVHHLGTAETQNASSIKVLNINSRN